LHQPILAGTAPPPPASPVTIPVKEVLLLARAVPTPAKAVPAPVNPVRARARAVRRLAKAAPIPARGMEKVNDNGAHLSEQSYGSIG
jgi:hypothetical protein